MLQRSGDNTFFRESDSSEAEETAFSFPLLSKSVFSGLITYSSETSLTFVPKKEKVLNLPSLPKCEASGLISYKCEANKFFSAEKEQPPQHTTSDS
jgi:hypothetical protein